MGWWSRLLGSEKRSLENPNVSISDAEGMLGLLGLLERNNALPQVSIEAALQVPAVFSIVSFLSRTMAALPLHTFQSGENGSRIDDGVAQLLSFAPNEGQTAFDWRRYHWQQVFTGGRGLSWIERAGGRALAIWPMDPALASIERRNGRKIYRFDGRELAAGDVIDTPFMLRPDGLGSYSPIGKCNKAISLAIAMGDFAGSFFAGGGVPPLSLEGPMPSGPDAVRRAQADIRRSIDTARKSDSSIFNIPSGYSLKAVGLDPDKGQMTEARLFQITEIARVWQVPPVFVQDLSKGTFSNTEQQDLWLVKHLVLQWAKAFEDELTLKLHGWRAPKQRVRHNLDGLQRGAFKDRVEALARAILTGQLTPDEARALEQRPPEKGGNRLYVQQATVPLVQAGATLPAPSNDDDQGDAADDDAGTEN